LQLWGSGGHGRRHGHDMTVINFAEYFWVSALLRFNARCARVMADEQFGQKIVFADIYVLN
jgi:hypothetical protein